jgi:hypothetical protein
MAQPTYPHNIKKDYVWWVEGKELAIAYANSTDGIKHRSTTGEWLSPHEISTIRLVTVRKAEPTSGNGSGTLLSALTDVPEIPSEFHKCLVYYAIARGHEKTVDGLKISQTFDGKYEMGVRKGVNYMGNERYYGIRMVTSNKIQGIL